MINIRQKEVASFGLYSLPFQIDLYLIYSPTQQTQIWNKMQELIKFAAKEDNYLKAIRYGKKIYNISESQLKVLSPNYILQLLRKQQTKAEMELNSNNVQNGAVLSKDQAVWHPNEYKLFCWISVCYGYSIAKKISEFEQQNYDFIGELFIKKNCDFITYHLINLVKRERVKEQWLPEEISILNSIIEQSKHQGRWSDISFALFQKSKKQFFRSSHKCREKWFNHLNPIVNHKKWTLQEDFNLLKLIAKIGCKWAQISKTMNGMRTEHMVKNRFNSLIKKYQTRFNKFSNKKMVENILKDLQTKLSIKTQPTIEDIPSLEIKQYFNSGDIETECQNIFKDQERELQAYASDDKLQQAHLSHMALQIDGCHIFDWNFPQLQQNLQLIDYLSMDYPVNKPFNFNMLE